MIALAWPLLWAALPACALDVEWGSVRPGGYAASLRVPGRVVAQEGALSVESARVPGRVTRILRREGEVVAAGEPLFVIASPECASLAEEKRVAAARGLSDLMEASRRREEQLGVSLAGAECRLLSSHDGTLAKRQVELGAAFNVGDGLATILDIRRLGVELDVPERVLSQVKPGQRVRVELASSPGETATTVVESILPTIDPATRAGRVRLLAPRLPPGTTLDALAYAEIDTGVRQQAFKVPPTAVVFYRDRQYVVKHGVGSDEAVAVDVLGETQEWAVVRPAGSGTLRQGDRVAVKGAVFLLKKLQDG